MAGRPWPGPTHFPVESRTFMLPRSFAALLRRQMTHTTTKQSAVAKMVTPTTTAVMVLLVLGLDAVVLAELHVVVQEPPQSMPSSFPLRTPSVQLAKAPGRKIHLRVDPAL